MHEEARRKAFAALPKTFVDHLTEDILLKIGSDFYTRQDLLGMECGNFIAAARLTKNLRKLRIRSVAELAKVDQFSLRRMKGVGDAQVYVAMCILDDRGYSIKSFIDGRGKKVKAKDKQEVAE